MQWLLSEQPRIDVRYRLAHLLLNPEIREHYGLILMDMPPRMTLGTVNAIAASQWFVIPTILDKLSAEAVGRFLYQLAAVKSDLGLQFELAGIVATMTHQAQLSQRELDARELVQSSAKMWGDKKYLVRQNLPRRSAIAQAAGDAIAYSLPGADGKTLRDTFLDPIIDELLTRIDLLEES